MFIEIKQWGTVFPGAASVVALVDRFAQHCHVIDIDADSWRQKSQAPSSKKAK
jgi:DNA replication protein DnaC